MNRWQLLNCFQFTTKTTLFVKTYKLNIIIHFYRRDRWSIILWEMEGNFINFASCLLFTKKFLKQHPQTNRLAHIVLQCRPQGLNRIKTCVIWKVNIVLDVSAFGGKQLEFWWNSDISSNYRSNLCLPWSSALTSVSSQWLSLRASCV